MKLLVALFVALVGLGLASACGSTPPRVALTEDWPAQPRDYGDVVDDYTRFKVLRGGYQEVLELGAVLKSPEWRAAFAEREATNRGLVGPARAQLLAQAQAASAGPVEVELLVTTWDRRENDLDHGKRSVWRVVLFDATGKEVEPLEIVKDKRPAFVLRAEFPALGDFSTAYIARFPHEAQVFGPNVKQVRLRMSGSRGAIEVAWDAP
jgi:hypothetical protein